ncbi:hypothetical protein CUC08_Gglean008554 [Alternaria sp. MG1]|nr:hypothetical protein CUC08_Gglean008554 [Alternaria sp. MG1]
MEQATQQQSRPRGLSFHSNKSNKSRDNATPKSPSKTKHERKASDHYDPNSKANPNAAMNEQQPIAEALTKPTLASLRSFQHTDTAGNPIADPDLSNPTRSRWERPLDTIRSFEAAIDGEYRRRAQSMRADQTDVMSGYGSRRSSYYGGGGGGYNDQNRFSTASGYFPQRQTQLNTNGSNGSHSDGPYSNDPSNSENSSIERGIPVQPPQQDMGSQYGFNGFGRGPIMEEYAQGPPPPAHGMPSQNGMAPPPPKHAAQAAPIKLGGGGPPATENTRPAMLSKKSSDAGDKRKSWFKRRFSKE